MPCLFAAFDICHRSHSPLCSLFQIPKPTKIQVKIGQLILSPLLRLEDNGGMSSDAVVRVHLFKHLKLVALCHEPFDGTRQGEEEFVETLHGVVERDDAARTGKALHVVQDVVAIQALGIVARHEVPHHDAVTLLDKHILLPFHPAVGRTEEVGFQIDVGLIDVAHITADAVAQTADVIEGVVAETVSRGLDHFKFERMLAYIVANHKESGLDAVVVEHGKHPRGHLGYGAVVEREIYGTLVRIHPPQRVGIEPA